MSKRETILAAMLSQLAGTTGVGSRIWRTRVEPIPREESPAIVIEPVRDLPEVGTHLATLTWTLTVLVTVVVRGPVPDQLADPIVESLHSKLMADTTIGGRAIDIMPGPVDFVFTEADGSAGEMRCVYRVTYRTSLANLAV